MADFAWALLIATARCVVEADRYVRAGQWEVAWHLNILVGRDLYGATLGVIGARRIVEAMIRRERALA